MVIYVYVSLKDAILWPVALLFYYLRHENAAETTSQTQSLLHVIGYEKIDL